MEKTKLIAQQALKIAELEEKIEIAKTERHEIYGILYCIGGPLNDNKLQYSKLQLSTFARIVNILGF